MSSLNNIIEYSNFNFKRGNSVSVSEIEYSTLYYDKNYYNIITSNESDEHIEKIMCILDSLPINLIEDIILKFDMDSSIFDIECSLINLNTNSSILLEQFQVDKKILSLKNSIKKCDSDLEDEKKNYELKLVNIKHQIKKERKYYEQKKLEINKFVSFFNFKCDTKQQELDDALTRITIKSDKEKYVLEQLGIRDMTNLGELYKRILFDKNHICHTKLVKLLYENLNGKEYDDNYAMWLNNCENVMDINFLGFDHRYLKQIIKLASSNYTITDGLLKSYYNDQINNNDNLYNKILIQANIQINKINNDYTKSMKNLNEKKNSYYIKLNRLVQ